MTPIDPFERQLPVALTRLADPRTPDYLTDILGRTARTRQRSAWRSLERWLPVPSLNSPRSIGLLVAAALAIALLGSALISGGGGPAPAPTTSPSPSPSVSPSLSPPAGRLPDGLQGGWVAPSRQTLAEGPGDVAFMVFGPPQDGTPVTFWLDPVGLRSTLRSAAEGVGPDEVTMRTYSPDGGCRIDDVGRYRWSTTADGQWLTLTRIEDACSIRAQVVSGTWQRSAAHSSAGGPVIAALFDPMFTVTLPEGDYTGIGTGQLGTLVAETPDYTLKVWQNIDGFADPCDIDAGRIDLEGLDEALAYFTDDPRFKVTRQEEFTIDGRRAVEIGLLIGQDLAEPCWDFDGNAADKSGVLTYIPDAAPGGFWNAQIGSAGRLVLTEVDGVTLAFEILTFDSGLQVDRPTLDTIRFLDALPTPPSG